MKSHIHEYSARLADRHSRSWLSGALGRVVPGKRGNSLPCDPLLLAAGALAGHGELNIVAVAIVAISVAGCGDVAGYFAGRKLARPTAGWLERSRIGKRLMTATTIEHGRSYFARYGGWAIFLSRWLVGAFSGVVNLLAGGRRFRFWSFFLYAVTGEALDTVLMLSSGAVFGASWASANNGLKVISGAILALACAALITVRVVASRRQARLDSRRQSSQ